LLVLLLRTGGDAALPADRGLGLDPQRVRRHETDAYARRRLGPHLDRHLRRIPRSEPRYVRHAKAFRSRERRDPVALVPEDVLPIYGDRLRRPGRTLAVPYVVAGRPHVGADCRLDGPRRRAHEARRIRHYPP